MYRLKYAITNRIPYWNAIPHYLIDALTAPKVEPRHTVMLNGFWRSGTTWIMEEMALALGAKSVFEPCALRKIPALQRAYDLNDYVVKGDRPSHMAYCPGDFSTHPGLEGYYADQLRSLGRYYELPRGRRTIRDSMTSRVVVKLTRGHLMLDALHNTFGVPLVHLTRDPRAVIASVMVSFKGTFQNVFAESSLKRLLLDPPDGRAAFFDTWRSEIERWDGGRERIVEKVAVYWSLTERYVHHLAANGTPIEFITYDRFKADGAALIRRVAAGVGVDLPETYTLSNRASATTSMAKTNQRKEDWRTLLSAEQIATITEIVQTFELEAYMTP